MKGESVCIILPALNEEDSIGRVIDEIPLRVLEDDGYRVFILVVDGNSSDRTRDIAREKGAEVLVHPQRGKGRQVRSVLEAVQADYFFMLDSDYTYPAGYIPDMLRVLRGGKPVVIGSRLRGKREKGAITPLNVVGNYMLTFIANLLYGVRISDICTGFWGIRGEVIPNLILRADGFQFEAELYTQLAKSGYKIAEMPIVYRRRATETKLNSVKDGLKIIWTLLHKRLGR